MPKYTRPVGARPFLDESGAVIDYGKRWDGSPPDDSYSRVSNPKRFAPLQNIADALIEHLRLTYLTDVAALEHSMPDTAKLIAVTPEHLDAAPLVFRFTSFPGVEIRAGVRYREAFPFCGCDACDETWGDAADEMERLVFAVSDGRFGERIVLANGDSARVEHRVESAGQGGRAGSTAHGVQVDPELRAHAARLDRLPNGRWQAWGR